MQNETINFINLEYFFNKIYQFFLALQNIHAPGDGGFFTLLRAIAFILIFLFLIFIVYTVLKHLDFRQKEHDELHHAIHAGVHGHGDHHGHTNGTAVHTRATHDASGMSEFEEVSERKNPRWKMIADNMKNENPANWRLAIIEADLMLEELLDEQGFSGANLGEKLKNAERGDFVTYQNAWEAHKVRNNIAHQGSDFNLDYRLARQTIDLYQTVFDEFNYI